MILKREISYRQVKENDNKTIYYSSRTVWWTDDPKDLQKSEDTDIPLDIFGSPLFMAPKDDFLKVVESKPDHYGMWELETFMAMHHKNFTPELGENYSRFSQREYFDQAVDRMKNKNQNFDLEH